MNTLAPKLESRTASPKNHGFGLKMITGGILLLGAASLLLFHARGISIAPTELPAHELFSLSDPYGQRMSDPEKSRSVIVIITSLDEHQGLAPEAWHLAAAVAESRFDGEASVYMVGDKHDSASRNKAIAQIQKQYRSGQRPQVLIDHQGSLRDVMGVPAGQTRIFVYDRQHQLKLVENVDPSDTLLRRVVQAASL